MAVSGQSRVVQGLNLINLVSRTEDCHTYTHIYRITRWPLDESVGEILRLGLGVEMSSIESHQFK